MENLKNKRILASVGLVCLFLGVILPYFKVSFFGYSYEIKLWGYWEGKIMMVLILSNILFIFKDYVEKYVPQLFNTNLGSKIQNANPKFAIVPTIGVAAFAVWLYLRLDVDTTYLKHGLGFWSLWAGVVCMLGHTFLYKKNLVSTSNNNTHSQSMQQPQQNVKFCPGCGNKCDANADRCFMCGRQF